MSFDLQKPSSRTAESMTIHQRSKKASAVESLYSCSGSELLYHACRLILVVVFLWSGVSKAFHPINFATVIDAYGLLPEMMIVPVAYLLIFVEILAAIGLLLEKRGALSLIALMTLAFIAILSFGIYLGLDIDCGCFGPNDPEAVAFHDLRGALVRDLFLFIAIAYIYWWRYSHHFKPRPWFVFGRRHFSPKEV